MINTVTFGMVTKLNRFQELDLSTNAYIFTESIQEGLWHSKVREALKTIPNVTYVKVCSIVMIMFALLTCGIRVV